MAEDSRDILMKIVQSGGEAIPAQCQAMIAAKDPLAKGFVSATAANQWTGNYCAVESFTFEVGLMADSGTGREQDPREKAKADREAQKKLLKQMQQMAKTAGQGGKIELPEDKSSGEFSRFMNQGRAARAYSANMEPVSISKQLDGSSLTLLKGCIESTTFDSAVLIKRRATGAEQLRSYLRIEFTSLLITEFGWDEDDVVKEKFKFVCRKAQVQYSSESFDGTMTKAPQPRTWSVLNLSNK